MNATPNIDPDRLVDGLRDGPAMPRLLVKSLVIHAVVIAITSIPYLMKCIHYGTTEVRSAMQQERMAIRETQRQGDAEERPETTQPTGDAPSRERGQRQGAPDDGAGVEPGETPAVPAGNRSVPASPDSDLNVDDEFGL